MPIYRIVCTETAKREGEGKEKGLDREGQVRPVHTRYEPYHSLRGIVMGDITQSVLAKPCGCHGKIRITFNSVPSAGALVNMSLDRERATDQSCAVAKHLRDDRPEHE